MIFSSSFVLAALEQLYSVVHLSDWLSPWNPSCDQLLVVALIILLSLDDVQSIRL